jgi:hypothetical protein
VTKDYIVNMSNMFKDCQSLVGINTSTKNPSETSYEFMVDEQTISFRLYEVQRLKQENPDFTFEKKNIPELRKQCTKIMQEKYPEDLL